MDRRTMLRGLLALPFAPLVAKLVPAESISEWFLRWPERHRPTLLDIAKQNDARLLPVIEVLSQRNHLLQDVVWKEKWHDVSEYILPLPRFP